MQESVNRNQLVGRATGSLFFTGFGAVWMVLGLCALEQLTILRAALLTVGVVATLGASAVWLFTQARQFPTVPEDPKCSRTFTRVNVVQWLAVFVVAFSFPRLGIAAYLMSAITAIVGLHMFPLARLFRYPMHYATGAVLVGWAIASTLLFSKDAMQGATALGTGAILWASAFMTNYLAAGLVKRHRTLTKPLASLGTV